MGVVMLRFDQGQRLGARPVAGELGREIFRMPIGDERLGRVIEKLGVERQIPAVVVEGFGVLEVALMLRKDRLRRP